MKSIEFCYWLQGFFELQNPQSFDQLQTDLVKKHLELVFKHDPNPAPFCCFLNGYFKLTRPKAINNAETETIKKYLYAIFEHVVETEPIFYEEPITYPAKPGMQLNPSDISEMIKC